LDPIWTKPDIAKVLVNIHTMNLKQVGLALCTCTWIEIMTGIGITLYLLYLSQFSLALITVAVFSPLIGFHFVVTKLSKLEDRCVNCHSLGYDAVASTDRIEA
jgi:hypothetical protein